MRSPKEIKQATRFYVWAFLGVTFLSIGYYQHYTGQRLFDDSPTHQGRQLLAGTTTLAPSGGRIDLKTICTSDKNFQTGGKYHYSKLESSKATRALICDAFHYATTDCYLNYKGRVEPEPRRGCADFFSLRSTFDHLAERSPAAMKCDCPPKLPIGGGCKCAGTCLWSGSVSYDSFMGKDALGLPCKVDGGMNGMMVFHICGIIYMFIALAIVVDEFFVPALDLIVKNLDIQPDMAGATFMAAGGSAPELFTSFIGTFVSQDSVGFGTIVGSAVFNILFVIGCCAIFSSGELKLTAWPLARDCSYYMFSLFMLGLFFGVLNEPMGMCNPTIEWYEALILLLMYGGYCTIMYNNDRLRDFFGFEKGEEDFDPEDLDDDERLKRANTTTHKFKTMAENSGFRGVNFNVGLYNMLVKPGDMWKLAGVYLLWSIEGDVDETFEQLDTDKSGYIEEAELENVLKKLQGTVTKEEVTECLKLVDTNADGKISRDEFRVWYQMASREAMLNSSAEEVFKQIDLDGNGMIDGEEFEALLKKIGHLNKNAELNDEDRQAKMAEVKQQNKNRKGTATVVGGDSDEAAAVAKEVHEDISLEEFTVWYNAIYSLTEEEPLLNLSPPENPTAWEFINYIVIFPLIFVLVYTLPDVRAKKRRNCYACTFFGSIMWLGIFSFLMVWWATLVGEVIGFPPEVMGLTFLAAGTSVPDLLSSVIVAQQGKGDMAVSSSIGSNIFDVLIGLPLPWLFYTMMEGKPMGVGADSLFVSLGILMLMLAIVVGIISYSGWIMSPRLGYSMFVLYFLFVAQNLLTNCNIMNQPCKTSSC